MSSHISMQTTRRKMLAILSSLGIGSLPFQRALAQKTEAAQLVTREMIADAEWIAGIQLSDQQRQMAADALTEEKNAFGSLREANLDYDLTPALIFQPLEDANYGVEPSEQHEIRFTESTVTEKPTASEDLAFLPVQELSALLRGRQISSTELTKLYLDRLRRFDPLLKCVVNYTEAVALRQAEKADREIAAGHYRGPLHGIPWGAKDLIAYPGYPTTWGAPQYRHRILDTKATVVKKLEEAGAVMIAKLSMGNYAVGDQWFAGKTRNPWNPHQGASGSSAGSASATSAGLVGFSLGSETLGSIVAPCQRCGVVGLRPTFGRVSRYGCMPLAWSLDKIGPICRSVEDCAVVFGAIQGADDHDPTTVDRYYAWPPSRDMTVIRVGYVEAEQQQLRSELEILRNLGVRLIPIEVPNDPLNQTLRIILTTESGAIFDELTRKQEPKGVKFWPKTWVMGQFISAIDYLRANRIRRRLMHQMRELMRKVDVIVGAQILVETNMTGHPQIVVPNGLRKTDDFQVPTSLIFTGGLYDESTLLSIASAYQKATNFHLRRPPIDGFLLRKEEFHQQEDRLDEKTLYE